MTNPVTVRDLGPSDYEGVFAEMRAFTGARGDRTEDEIWLTEHEPVFTQGQAGRPEHLLAPGSIPVVQTDRGGQITYHGPGQIVAYVMLDLRRLGLSVRGLVSGLETAMIRTLDAYGIEAAARPDAPGVYVGGAKIGSLGLRVRRHCSYHGLALNVNMDLEPFSRINPCGLTDVKVTQIVDLGGPSDPAVVRGRLVDELAVVYDLTAHTPGIAGFSAA